MSYYAGAASTAGNYQLTFNNTIVGDFVQSFVTKSRRLTNVQRRENFWSNTGIIDGSFPVQFWDHEFTIYLEKSDRELFATALFDLSDDNVTSSPTTLTLVGTGSYANWSFGACYLERVDLQTPSQMLLHAAGFLTVKFVGNTKPTSY